MSTSKMWALVGATAVFLAGCSNSRDVEVTGEVSAASGVATNGKIVLDFLDVIDENETPKSVHSLTLDAPGPFTATAPLAGDEVIVRAIADGDGNGACSAGEAWGEVAAQVSDDDTVADVKITLAPATCPVTPSAE